VGNVQVAHGRAPAAATGLKRACPDKIVIAYQGDGDLAAIGTAEIVHAANRGEKISVFFVNNAIYGMTGGQMAPTTLVGQKSTTSPWGRRPINEGFPLHMAEMLATLEAPVYIERVALSDNKNIMKARRAVRKALELQRAGAGFTFVEILSPCPTIWGKDPVEARKWIAEKMIPNFPLNVFRDRAMEIADNNVPPHKTVAELVEGEHKTAGVASVPAKHHYHDLGIKIAGFGGQGVLLLGQLLAEMGMREGLEVSWLPSYGPEMRSGSAHCHVCLSKDRIGSPVLSRPGVLIAMNEISLRKFYSQIAPGGTIIYGRDHLPPDLANDLAVSSGAGRLHSGLRDRRQAGLRQSGQHRHAGRAAGRNRMPVGGDGHERSRKESEESGAARTRPPGAGCGPNLYRPPVAIGAVTQADGFAQ
jgi:2-oxoisovalerate ferredoxin oxidoreductase beta subunit